MKDPGLQALLFVVSLAGMIIGGYSAWHGSVAGAIFGFTLVFSATDFGGEK